jgi:hypothetical protein
MPEVEVQDAPLFMSDQFQGEGFSYQFNMSKVKKEKWEMRKRTLSIAMVCWID